MTWDTERMCRLNGKKPTDREKWTAFYRLYRMTQRGRNAEACMEAADCLRILMADWSWLLLVQSSGTMLTGPMVPKFLRYKFLEIAKRKRLYGEGYKWLDRSKLVAMQMHEQGIEVTPEEVAETRLKVIRMIRDKANADNIRIPEDDEELLRWIAQGRTA